MTERVPNSLLSQLPLCCYVVGDRYWIVRQIILLSPLCTKWSMFSGVDKNVCFRGTPQFEPSSEKSLRAWACRAALQLTRSTNGRKGQQGMYGFLCVRPSTIVHSAKSNLRTDSSSSTPLLEYNSPKQTSTTTFRFAQREPFPTKIQVLTAF